MKTMRRVFFSVGIILLIVSLTPHPAYSQQEYRLYLPMMVRSDPVRPLITVTADEGRKSALALPYPNIVLHNTLFFIQNCNELWAVDASGAPAQLVRVLSDQQHCNALSGFTMLGDRFFFTFANADQSVSLWHSDGTETGTSEVRRFYLTEGEQLSVQPFSDGSKLFLFLSETLGTRNVRNVLWVSDGTAAGTRPLYIFGPTSIFPLATLNGKVLFSSQGQSSDLWATDGTIPGTQKIASNSPVFSSLVIGDQFWFATEQRGYALAVTDGTSVGTRTVKVFDGAAGPDQFIEWEGQLYFTLYIPPLVTWFDLWKSDGTEAGTQPIGSGEFRNLATLHAHLYFTSNRGDDMWGRHMLYRRTSDGTVTLITNRVTIPQRFFALSQLYATDNYLFFEGSTEAHGSEPWFSDGTDAGTRMLADLTPGNASTEIAWLGHSSTALFFLETENEWEDEYWGRPRSYTIWAVPLDELQ